MVFCNSQRDYHLRIIATCTIKWKWLYLYIQDSCLFLKDFKKYFSNSSQQPPTYPPSLQIKKILNLFCILVSSLQLILLKCFTDSKQIFLEILIDLNQHFINYFFIFLYKSINFYQMEVKLEVENPNNFDNTQEISFA